MKTVTDFDRADFVVDGQQGETLNGLCKALNAIKKDIAPLEAEKKDITNDIKTLLQDETGVCNAGTYVSSKYNILITKTEKKLTIDLEKFAEIDPELFQSLAVKFPKVTKEVITLKKVTER